MTATLEQEPVIAFLASPEAHGGAPVERIDTHAAIVFLVGNTAYKLKRAVTFDYLDFSTVERRQASCEAELRLNRRSAPSLYRRVIPVTSRPDGTLALGGDGVPVDWVLEMARFAQEALFDRLASAGLLDVAQMTPLAHAIATYHRDAAPRRDHGGRAGMRWVVEGNASGLDAFGGTWIDAARVEQVTAASRAAVERLGALLDARRDAGLVRQCHGDLHLRNIVLLEGRPTLFDAVEFNDEIACVDVLYDLAFLLMDLWRRGLPRHANAVWNQYLAAWGSFDGLAVLPLFLSCRAAVRAKTSATAASQQQDAATQRVSQEASAEYLVMADQLLRPAPARLVAVGGLSGSGKSTVAQALAPHVGAAPGAVVLRSDAVRKRLHGVEAHTPLSAEAYAAGTSARVYATLAEEAAGILTQGQSVVVDAVFARAADRAALARVAADVGVPWTGLWLDAPLDVLVDRVTRRRGDVSDADADVVRRQMRDRHDTADSLDWTRVDATGAPGDVLARAQAIVDRLDEHR